MKNKKLQKKLDCQFGHAIAQKLQKLVKASNIKDNDLLNLFNEIKNNCEICIKHKKSGLKLAVDKIFYKI